MRMPSNILAGVEQRWKWFVYAKQFRCFVSITADLVGIIYLSLSFLTLLVLTYYSGLILYGKDDDIQWVITLEISKPFILAVLQLKLYASEGSAPDYYVELLCFDHANVGMLCRLQSPLINVLSPLVLSETAEMIRMNPLLPALTFHWMTENDWSSWRDSDYLFAYDVDADTVHGYPSEKRVPVKRQKFDQGPVLPVLVPVVDTIWLRMWLVWQPPKLSVITGGGMV